MTSQRSGAPFNLEDALNGNTELFTDSEARLWLPRPFVLTDAVMRTFATLPPDPAVSKRMALRLIEVYRDALIEADRNMRHMLTMLQVDSTVLERRTEVTWYHTRRAKVMLVLIEKTQYMLHQAAKLGNVGLKVLQCLEHRILIAVFPHVTAMQELFVAGAHSTEAIPVEPLIPSDGTLGAFLAQQAQRRLVPAVPHLAAVPPNALKVCSSSSEGRTRTRIVPVAPSDPAWAKMHADLNAMQSAPRRTYDPAPTATRQPDRFQLAELYEIINVDQQETYVKHATRLRVKNASEGMHARIMQMRRLMTRGSTISDAMEASGANEFLLFHGTSPASAAAIVLDNFDVRMTSPSARLGRGIYFTSSASKAHMYAERASDKGDKSRVMLVCRVLMGNPFDTPVIAAHELSRPPRFVGAQYEQLFDSLVYMRNGEFPEFVVYESSAVCPLYYVVYRENLVEA